MNLTEIMLLLVALMLLLLCLNTSVLVTQLSEVLDHLALLNDLDDDEGDGGGRGYRFDPDPRPDSPRDAIDIDLAWRETMRAAKTK